MNILFICYSYQKNHFLISHAEEIKLRGGTAEFYILDSNVYKLLNASRRGFLDIPIHVFFVYKLLIKSKANLIITITPKSGFILLLAKAIQSISFSKKSLHVHWFTGQVWCNDIGIKRYIKKIPDLLLSKYSDFIFLDSNTQLNYLNNNNFNILKYFVPGRGSICGVNDVSIEVKENISSKKITHLRVGIVGRICEDKGIPEICEWINNNYIENIIFNFYGPMDFNYQKSQDYFVNFINKNNDKCHYLGDVSDKNDIYDSIDVLLLCSSREGFSNVLIEAQLYAKPVIVRNIYGVKDSYINNITGFEFSDFDNLHLLFSLLKDTDTRSRLGENARKFVRENFLRTSVVSGIVNKYEGLIYDNLKK
jgi:glycosyltransferase involved in cell wall biosynthesis